MIWNTASGRKSSEELQLLFESLRPEAKVRSIRLEWNRIPSILTYITLSSFPALRTLNLGANRITTI